MACIMPAMLVHHTTSNSQFKKRKLRLCFLSKGAKRENNLKERKRRERKGGEKSNFILVYLTMVEGGKSRSQKNFKTNLCLRCKPNCQRNYIAPHDLQVLVLNSPLSHKLPLPFGNPIRELNSPQNLDTKLSFLPPLLLNNTLSDIPFNLFRLISSSQGVTKSCYQQ